MGKIIRTDINNMAKDFTLTLVLTGIRKFKIRCWLALRILDLLALVAPFSIKVEE